MNLDKRIYIKGITSEPMNIVSMNYNINNFIITLELENSSIFLWSKKISFLFKWLLHSMLWFSVPVFPISSIFHSPQHLYVYSFFTICMYAAYVFFTKHLFEKYSFFTIYMYATLCWSPCL
jgi:hypothetical protein